MIIYKFAFYLIVFIDENIVMDKKALFRLTVFIILCQEMPVNAQTRFSMYADPIVSWFRDDRNAQSHGIVPGFRAGLGMDHFFAENYAVTTDLLILHAGGKLSYADSILVQTAEKMDTLPKGSILKYRIRYLSAPLGLKFTTDEIGYLTFYARVGFNPMFRLGARGRTTVHSLDKSDISEEVGRINLGYYIGIGAYYSLGGNTSLVVGLNYTGGMVDVTKKSLDQVMMSHLGLQLGILF